MVWNIHSVEQMINIKLPPRTWICLKNRDPVQIIKLLCNLNLLLIRRRNVHAAELWGRKLRGRKLYVTYLSLSKSSFISLNHVFFLPLSCCSEYCSRQAALWRLYLTWQSLAVTGQHTVLWLRVSVWQCGNIVTQIRWQQWQNGGQFNICHTDWKNGFEQLLKRLAPAIPNVRINMQSNLQLGTSTKIFSLNLHKCCAINKQYLYL